MKAPTMNPMNNTRRRIGFFALALLTAATALGVGGCSNQKKQNELTIADLRSENEALRTENDTLTQSLAQANERAATLESENATLRTAATQPATDTGTGMSAGMGATDRILTIAGDVAFGSGQVTLTAAGRREIDKIISEIQSRYPGHRIEIAGFTDTDPLRKTKDKYTDNENLSAQRALAVERYMNSKGIPADLTHSSAYGPSKPKATKQASRRVEVKILAN